MEINVIVDAGKRADLHLLDAREYELYFDELGARNPDIPYRVILDFAELQRTLIRRSALNVKPEITELLLRKIIILAAELSHDNHLVIPVCKSDAGHKLRFDRTIFVVRDDRPYRVPAGEEIQVHELVINEPGRPAYIVHGGTLMQVSRVLGGADLPPGVPGQYTLRSIFEEWDHPTQTEITDEILSRLFDYCIGIFTTRTVSAYHQSRLSTARGLQILASHPGCTPEYPDRLYASEIGKITRPIRGCMVDYSIPDVHEDEPIPAHIIGVVSALDTLARVCLPRRNVIALYSTLDDLHLSDIYYSCLLRGVHNSTTEDLIRQYRDRMVRTTFHVEMRENRIHEANMLATYMMIIEQRLGSRRVAEIESAIRKKPGIVLDARGVLTLLQQREAKMVSAEFQRRQEYITASTSNRCPHVGILSRLRQATRDIDTRTALSALYPYMRAPYPDSEFIRCIKCGFNLICPHQLTYLELEIAKTHYLKVRAKLAQYIDGAATRGTLYCRICSEIVSADISESATFVVHEEVDEELRNAMWNEIILLMKYLRFSTPTNIAQFVTIVRDSIYSYIATIDRQLLKTRTGSADEIKARRKLFIVTYALVYITRMIEKPKSGVGYRDHTMGDRSRADITALVKHAIGLVSASCMNALRVLPDITVDIIRGYFVEAYRSIQGVEAYVPVAQNALDMLLLNLAVDPIPWYQFNMVNLCARYRGAGKKKRVGRREMGVPGIYIGIYDSPCGRASMSKVRADYLAQLTGIMGGTLEEIEQRKNIYSKIVLASTTCVNVGGFDEIPPLEANIAEASVVLARVYPGYVVRSYEYFMRKFIEGLHTLPVYVNNAAAAGAALVRETRLSFAPKFGAIISKLSSEYEEYYRVYTGLAPGFDLVEKYRQMIAAGVYGTIEYRELQSNQEYDLERDAGLGITLDESGRDHVWGIYLVEDRLEENARSEIKIRDPRFVISGEDRVRLAEIGHYARYRIVDRRCTVCGILYSDTDQLSNKLAGDSWRETQDIANFYKYYETRCPVSGYHVFVGAEKICDNCGLQQSMLNSPLSEDARPYYRAHHAEYYRERHKIAAPTAPAKVVEDPYVQYADEYSAWAFDYNVVVELASRTKVHQRLLVAMGATEGHPYSEIESGVYIPLEAEERRSTRASVIYSYILLAITEYNQLKYVHKIAKPLPDILAVIDAAKYARHNLSELEKKLPNISTDIHGRYRYFQIHKKPRDIVNFCIESYCRLCLRMYDIGDGAGISVLMTGFVSYVVHKTLTAGRMLSLPGYFNMSLLYGTKDISSQSGVDLNFVDDSKVGIEADGDWGEKAADQPDNIIHSLNPDFDMDSEDDAEDQQGLRIGEDRGL